MSETTERVAGRALDAEIATRVMGEAKRETPVIVGVQPREMWWNIDGTLMEHPPEYSTDIAAAFRAVDVMRGQRFQFVLKWLGHWHAEFFVSGIGNSGYANHPESAAFAICLAALNARDTRKASFEISDD